MERPGDDYKLSRNLVLKPRNSTFGGHSPPSSPSSPSTPSLAGGMERPGDDYKLTHNLVLKPRDSTFGGQVSRLQVAELVAASISQPELAENKVRA